MRMGRLSVTDTQSRFTYEQAFIDAGLPGIGVLFKPEEFGRTTIAWDKNAWFDLHPQFQTLIPPKSDNNFQRRLILAYLDKIGVGYQPGFDTDWKILMVAGHGAIGHLDIFETDDKAREWYASTERTELFTIKDDFGFSLKEFLNWMDEDAGPLLAALGPTPSVGGAVPKLLLSIPAGGWDGRVGVPRRGNMPERTDVVLKIEKETYPGIVELEALTLDIHKQAGFDVPRYWKTEINGLHAIAIERYDRTPQGKPLFTESLYAVMASGSSQVTNHYSVSYDTIGAALLPAGMRPFVTDPRREREHLLKRLLYAFATGNGDLHMENMSFANNAKGEMSFSPVYDPTPMRAYSRHNELAPVEMTFGGYGDFDKHGNIIAFQAAVQAFARGLDINKAHLNRVIDEVLENTGDFTRQIDGIENLPGDNKKNLVTIVNRERAELIKVKG
jgi:serine/threonine-protein kinase HipA